MIVCSATRAVRTVVGVAEGPVSVVQGQVGAEGLGW